MKVLIWIGSFIVYLIINILLHPFGVRLGYLFGLAFAVLIPLFLCKKWDIRVIEKEAHSKGMSIYQYISSIVPPSLMTACEAYKGNHPALKETLKRCVEENAISKPVSKVLFEMFK